MNYTVPQLHSLDAQLYDCALGSNAWTCESGGSD